jgi:hypothetical protein
MTKDETIERLVSARRRWHAALGDVPRDRMELAGAIGSWSVKDLIAHVSAYEAYVTDRLLEALNEDEYEPAQTGEALTQYIGRYGYPDFGSPLLDDDEANALVRLFTRADPLDDVIEREEATAQRLANYIRAMPRGWWTDDWAARVAANTWEHIDEHIAGLRAWLAAQAG